VHCHDRAHCLGHAWVKLVAHLLQAKTACECGSYRPHARRALPTRTTTFVLWHPFRIQQAILGSARQHGFRITGRPAVRASLSQLLQGSGHFGSQPASDGGEIHRPAVGRALVHRSMRHGCVFVITAPARDVGQTTAAGAPCGSMAAETGA